MYDLGILNGKCYIDGDFVKTHLYIHNEKIVEISLEEHDCHKTLYCDGYYVLPGLIDPHVHLKLDLGEFVSCDDFISGSRAAAYGGVTTLLDFMDPIWNNESYETVFAKRMEDAKDCQVDYSFHCTLGNYKDDIKALVDLNKSHGITSIKAFTTYKESDRMCSYNIIGELLKTDQIIMVHSEDNRLITQATDIASYEQSRPEIAERTAVNKLINLMTDKSHLYIVHVSSGHTIDQLKNRPGLYLESCPQYFYLNSDKFLERDGAKYLLAPPLRSHISITMQRENINKYMTFGTDHCPFMLEDKLKYQVVEKIPKGIGTLEFAFPLMYNLYGFDILDQFTTNPARIFGLEQKGRLKIGCDGDLAIFDPHGETNCSYTHSACDYSIYPHKLKGKIVTTVLRGQILMDSKGFYPLQGHFIRRSYEGNY